MNGEPVEVRAGATIADIVTALTDAEDPKGVAVAVDRCRRPPLGMVHHARPAPAPWSRS